MLFSCAPMCVIPHCCSTRVHWSHHACWAILNPMTPSPCPLLDKPALCWSRTQPSPETKTPEKKDRWKGGDRTRAGPVSSLREQDNPLLPHTLLTNDTPVTPTYTLLSHTGTMGRWTQRELTCVCGVGHWGRGCGKTTPSLFPTFCGRLVRLKWSSHSVLCARLHFLGSVINTPCWP